MKLKKTVHFNRELGEKGDLFRQHTMIDVEVPEARKEQVKAEYQIGMDTVYSYDGKYWIDCKGMTVAKLTAGFQEGDLPFRPAENLDAAIRNARKDAQTYLVADYEKVYRAVEKPAYAVVMRGGIPTVEAVYTQYSIDKLPKFCKLYPPEARALVLAHAKQVARMITLVPEEEIRISRNNEIQILAEKEKETQVKEIQTPKLAPGFVLEAMDNPEILAAFIAGHHQTTPYCGVNEESEQVRISVSAVHGMEVRTNQSNGWIRVTYFDTRGFLTGESYDGKWNKEVERNGN